jgi:hypothetical protein
MRLRYLILLAFIGLASCGPAEMKGVKEANGSILFVTTPVQSPSLLVRPTLRCFAEDQRMELSIALENLDTEKITISEISFNNSNGLNSSVENLSHKKWMLPVGSDTTLVTTLRHINDKNLFHTTGLPGLIDSVYNLSVFYTVDGKEGMRIVNLVSKMPTEMFLSYRKKYDDPVQLYIFNTTNGFDEKQKEFLVRNKITKASPFVHITEQEVAVSGLNFRVKCFQVKDSLFTEIFAVNHSDMTVKIDTSKIDVIVEGLSKRSTDANISIEKVTGSKEDINILGKGDRTIIKMRRKVDESPEKLLLSFASSFFLSNGRPLFSDDLQLIRSSDGKASN